MLFLTVTELLVLFLTVAELFLVVEFLCCTINPWLRARALRMRDALKREITTRLINFDLRTLPRVSGTHNYGPD